MVILKIIADEKDTITIGDLRRLPDYIPDETPVVTIQHETGKRKGAGGITYADNRIIIE